MHSFLQLINFLQRQFPINFAALSLFTAEARIYKFRIKNMLVHVEMDITDAIAMLNISDMTRTLSFFIFLTFVTFSAFDKD